MLFFFAAHLAQIDKVDADVEYFSGETKRNEYGEEKRNKNI